MGSSGTQPTPNLSTRAGDQPPIRRRRPASSRSGNGAGRAPGRPLRLPVTGDGGDTDDLARMDGQRHVAQMHPTGRVRHVCVENLQGGGAAVPLASAMRAGSATSGEAGEGGPSDRKGTPAGAPSLVGAPGATPSIRSTRMRCRPPRRHGRVTAPRRSTVIRSAVASTSRNLCVMNSTASPSCRNVRKPPSTRLSRAVRGHW